MSPESRSNAIIGTLGNLMVPVYNNLSVYMTALIRDAVAEERAVWEQVIGCTDMDLEEARKLAESIRERRMA